MSFALSFLRSIPGWLSPKGWMVVGVLAGVLILWITILAWGDRRYDAGVTDTDAKWEEASAKLAAQAAKSADAATRREAPRIANHAAQVAAEKEKIDDAIDEGRSPLDALFPAR